WTDSWYENKLYQPDLLNAKNPYYNLMMFPYPSAEGLHVGNMYAFTGSDVFGRYMRMQGYDVFEPIGLDGFGIHSENYAIKQNVHPKDMSKKTQENFYRQMKLIGNGFAWDNRLETYDPSYYKWTQWLFLQMFKNDLAYQSVTNVNWCPACKTVLSDEQVEHGQCERCKSEVTQKSMKQWFFRITKYADQLIDDLEKVDWENKIKSIQKNWIGKSTGEEIEFEIEMPSHSESTAEESKLNSIKVFTTRPDTIKGVTFLVLSPEHQLAQMLVSNKSQIPSNQQELLRYIEESRNKSDQERLINKEKTGVFTGYFAINPITLEKLPIWIADYVLSTYATGAVMGVPFSDERDKQFAEKFDIEIKQHDEYKKQVGVKHTTFKLRDWCISRQRYWGAPIPIIYCDQCGTVPVDEADLPVLLPDSDDYLPSNDGKAPLARNDEFVSTKCPKCGKDAKRETDVCDTFLDSSWYYLRYPSTGSGLSPSSTSNKSKITSTKQILNSEMPWDKETTKKWLPVDKYIGGAEHAVLHLLYSRFVTKALRDFGFLDFDEPFINLRAHGLIIKDGSKMSKSKGNVINPDEYIERFGTDTLRTYLMFMGPLSQGGDFRDNAILGVNRFLNRVWKTTQTKTADKTSAKLQIKLNWAIEKCTTNMPNLKYNVAIASLMEFLNEWESDDKYIMSKEDTTSFLKLLAPMAPFITEELYSIVDKDNTGSIHVSAWPNIDETLVAEKNVEIAVQVNGVVRTTITIKKGTNEADTKVLALKDTNVLKHIGTNGIQRVIYIQDKIINLVV
ncbi:MAG: class I tRNA ligase family protein, partial [bacterium]|nr:class I tRNA ligase family protein [bacterium]